MYNLFTTAFGKNNIFITFCKNILTHF